jgi:ATP-binding cassette, subfamily B, bacterial PglK
MSFKEKSHLMTLWLFLSRRRKRQFFILLIIMIFASLTEIVSLGAVIPFLGALTAPEQIFNHPIAQSFIQILNLTKPNQIIFPLTIFFIFATLFAGIVRLGLLYIMTRLSFATGADLSIDIYKRTLYQEYSIHVARNSSEVINGIIVKTNTVINGIITPAMTLISSIIILVGIISVLFFIDIKVALTASIGFGFLYGVVIFYTKTQLKENSQCDADQSTLLIKSLQEGLGGIRDVLIAGSQQYFCDVYRNADLPLRRAKGNITFISASPRYAMESLGMILIAGLAYIMTQQQGGIATVIPVLGAFALGAQRLLPLSQQAYSSFSTIKGSSASFLDVLDLLEQPLPGYLEKPKPVPIKFEKAIQLSDIGFSYAKNLPLVLESINLKLTKGSRIGFIGVTGSGKSTLLDIIMGLLTPTTGEIAIDGHSITKENIREWQAHIAHVPQNIYLSDGTIEENIAFGIPKETINHHQVEKVAKQAQISELIEGWQEGYKTFVGERGVKLSGGQRQRIGIARALYKSADVLIFDEATSALDNTTEKDVMKSIKGLEKELTVLIIAHRLTTIKDCDQIVKLEKNKIRVGSYQEVIGKQKD